MPKSTVSGSQADFVRGDATFAPPSATLTIDGTAADIQPLGVQAAGATGKPPDAGHVHPYQPWQFYVRGYGARGDGIMLADVAMAASSKVLTSPSASFSGADVGKHILVNNAGSAPASDTSGALITTIASLQVVCPPNPGQIALDFFQMAQFAIKTASLDVFASVTGTPTIQFTSGGPTNGNGQGLRVPSAGLNDRCDIDSLSVEGYYYGMSVDEHIAARRVAIIYTNTGIYVPAHGGNQASHGCWIGYASVEICQYCVWSESASGSLFGLYIDVLDNEGPVTEHIHDPSGYLSGKVSILPSNSASLPQAPVVNGAANLEIISLSQPRAVQSAPSYTLGTPFQNPWWRHADVELAGGTVSAVKTGPAAAALTTRAATSGRFRLPSGWWMEIDGTVAPTTFLADTD